MATDWSVWRPLGATANTDAQPGQTYGQYLNGWLEWKVGGANPQTQGTIASDPGYMIDDIRVWLKGQVRAGTMNAAIFRLPPYASPSSARLLVVPAVTSTGALITCVLEILALDPTGANPGSDVIPRGAANVRLALDGSFVMK